MKIQKIKYKTVILVAMILFLSTVGSLGAIQTNNITALRQFLLCICYIMLTSFLWKNKYTKIISVILMILWVLNVSISIAMYRLYSSHFNEQLAIVILSTDFNEAKDFLLINRLSLSFSILLFIMLFFCSTCFSKTSSNKVLIILSITPILLTPYKFIESACKGRLQNFHFNMLEQIMPYTSLDNFGFFSRAYSELSLLNKIDQNKKVYSLKINETGINNYVIVIGESLRTDHLSLYGYHRKTTPNLDKIHNDLFIFDKAVAPAPTTVMSLASVLTKKSPDSLDYSLLGDNVIKLANQAGYKTYWYSKQGKAGPHETPISIIAKDAYKKEWIVGGYDDRLLDYLNKALTDNSTNKKLIVLHTLGSHSIPCNKYPPEETFFLNDSSVYEDCYDNSILFTDKLLKTIFELLKNDSSSVLYFSDHGQRKRIKNGNIEYLHGSIKPSKQSVDVPQFIWFSNKVPFSSMVKKGHYSDLYSTSDNYSLIANWIGITSIDDKQTTSPLNSDFKKTFNRVLIMDMQQQVFDYQNLQSDLN